MSRFRYVSGASLTPTTEQIAAAEICLNANEMQAANKAIGKYTICYNAAEVPANTPNREAVMSFVKSYLEGLTKGANSVEVSFNADKNSNSAQVVKTDGSKEFVTIWGNGRGNTLPAMSVPAKDVKFGFCISDGEIVTEMKSNPITGKVAKYIRMYADISAVL